ncbi:MAG: hypothetical protein MUE98_01010 [Rhodobacteraceae bacterium]|jgi:hypothetical protein|nr:hypothetical protein [Paracoccaceae bacterium]
MPRRTTLSVASGRHAGASLALDPGRHVVGRDAGCDIVLSDPAVAPRHLQIDIGRKSVRVAALDAAVGVPGRGEIASGFRAALGGAIPLDLGGIRLQIVQDAGAGRGALVSAMTLAGALVLGAAGGHWLVSSAAGGNAGPEGPGQPAGLAALEEDLGAPPEGAATPAPRHGRLPDAVAAAAQTSRQLQSMGLGGLEFRVVQDRFVLTGSMSPASAAAFEEFQRWFDTAFPALVLEAGEIAVDDRERASVTPPAIQSAWHVGRPYLMISGSRYYVGDPVRDGWIVDDIRPEAADFRFEGRRYTVPLAGTERSAQVAR